MARIHRDDGQKLSKLDLVVVLALVACLLYEFLSVLMGKPQLHCHKNLMQTMGSDQSKAVVIVMGKQFTVLPNFTISQILSHAYFNIVFVYKPKAIISIGADGSDKVKLWAMKFNCVNGVSQINKIKCMRDYFQVQQPQNQPTQMGLFTFYKQQQSQSQAPNTLPFKRGNELKGRPKGRKKNGVLKYLRDSQEQQQRGLINKSMNCYDFLKNIRMKGGERQSLIKRQQLNFCNLNCTNSNEFAQGQVTENLRQDSCLDLQQPIELRQSNKKFELGNSINEQSIPAYIIRKKYFAPHRNKEALSKQLYRMEQNLIIKIQKKELHQGPRFPTKTNIKPTLQERLNHSFKGRSNRNDSMKTESNREMVAHLNRQPLTTKNKKYIHNLMQSASNKSQYNQTAYKILRETYKLPSCAHRLKTQGSTQIDNKLKSAINSLSVERDSHLQQKQTNYFQHKYLRTPI